MFCNKHVKLLFFKKMLLKNLHVSTAFYHIPVFSSWAVPSAHLHVHCVLVQHASLICNKKYPFRSLIRSLCKRLQNPWYTNVLYSQIRCSRSRPIQVLVGLVPSSGNYMLSWHWVMLLRSPRVFPALDTKTPLALTPWGLLASHKHGPSPGKCSLKGRCSVSVRKCI